ncbi:META domain-containing protein [Marinigracilibium pacificum]|uniref:META domain-containing protein n=1 Tax=Marinigracilibium pacificum TaxID=2729599 RepID=A0A848IV22_9BACT|nr:META domain-containing protein [Marinigracilibium pacificum]NMM47536.1 META domain-containing protein [Marinigracilibium pacificum]
MNYTALKLSVLLLLFISCSPRNESGVNDDNKTINTKIGKVDFEATDSNTWNLLLTFDQNIILKIIDNDEDLEYIFPTNAPIPIQDVNATSYRSKNDEHAINIMIRPEKCLPESNYTVTVQLINNTSNEINSYEGCGNYRGQAAINGVWILNSINGNTISSERKKPNIQFDVANKKVIGYSGCNMYKGNLEIKDSSILLNSLTVTENSCPDDNLEPQYLEFIKSKDLTFNLNSNILTIKGGNQQYIYKRLE